MIILYKEDPLAKKLPVHTYKVADWGSKGSGKYQRYFPLAWYVADDDLEPGDVPLTKQEALEIRENRSSRGRKAAKTRKEKDDAVAQELGLNPGSRTAAALRRGELSREDAEGIAAYIKHRHEDTDYDDLLRAGCDKDTARELMKSL